MPEHTPAPTPSRSVYGFVLYLGTQIFFFLYLIWALVPEPYFEAINITYLPQKYWAVTIPIFLLTVLATFAFIIYPSINLCMTPAIDDIRTVKDHVEKKAKYAGCKTVTNLTCCCNDVKKCSIEEYKQMNKDLEKYKIPMVEDLCMQDVSKLLYLR